MSLQRDRSMYCVMILYSSSASSVMAGFGLSPHTAKTPPAFFGIGHVGPHAEAVVGRRSGGHATVLSLVLGPDHRLPPSVALDGVHLALVVPGEVADAPDPAQGAESIMSL
eukprot:12291180-Alexandrium_andersonii.AAC.1